jgi:hypothetical protein
MSIKWKYEGIGSLLAAGGLRVPKHQREYSWKKDHVEQLLEDFSGDTLHGDADYFLGTIVLTSPSPGQYQVVDGQQRLATATMIFAALRDIHRKRGETGLADSIVNEMLSKFDPEMEESTTKLILNVKDNSYFNNRIIYETNNPSRHKATPMCPSNKNIEEAAGIIRSHLEKAIEQGSDKTKKETLKKWAHFLKFQAKVAAIEVEDASAAYVMFETLNDRGVEVSKADLVKNYLFGLAGDDRFAEIEGKWTSIVSLLATIGEDDAVVDYLRIYCSMAYELTRQRMVFKRVKKHVGSAFAAAKFLETLEIFAADYVAMLSSSNPKWNDYPEEISRTLRTLNGFSNVTQIRVLALAVAHYLSPKEASAAFRLFVNWIIRLFIAGAGKLGRVEAQYASLANAIHRKEIKTASALSDAMRPELPNDEQFEAAFAVADVSKESLARYYLDSLERCHQGDEDRPELVPAEDTSKVNLEHILPENPHNNWPKIDAQAARDYYNRIGNIALMNAKKNAALGNASFKKKRASLADSPFTLTQWAGKPDDWGPDQINERQSKMAKLALKTWPLKV